MGAGRTRFMRGPSLNVGFADVQPVHVQIFEPVGRVGDGRLQHLQDRGRDALVDGAQRGARRARLLAADQVHDQARFLRGDPDVSGFRFNLGVGFHGFSS